MPSFIFSARGNSLNRNADQYDQFLSIVKQHIDLMAKENVDAALSFLDEVRRYINKVEAEIREETGKYDNDAF